MNRVATTLAVCLLAISAQAAPAAKGKTARPVRKNAAVAQAEDLQSLKSTVTAQQQQIEELKGMVQQLLQQNQQAQTAAQHAQSSADQAATNAQQVQTTLAEVKKAADHAEFSAAEAKTKEQLDADASGKKMDEVASVVKRFRPTGDIRLRLEPIYQDLTPDRYRARVRLRFGFEGKVNEDFIGGFQLATGTVTDDAVSTNFTEGQFFTRKPIGVDKAFITYAPQNLKWLTFTGGKFAPIWNKTALTIDPDLNPEGAQERFSFDFKKSWFKNLSVYGMQLVFNEVAGSNLPVSFGGDGTAMGGQLAGTFQFGSRVTTTLSGGALNFINSDQIIRAISGKTLAGNRNTNATVGPVTPVPGFPNPLRYQSQFLYADFIADTTVKTWWDKYPVRFLLDYDVNPRANDNNDQAFWAETFVGQQKNPHDLQLSYAFARIEQDAVIAAFNESELRAPTNVLQHKVALNYLLRKNTTATFTGWFGRTLDRNLQNAAFPTGLSVFEHDPYLQRLQFDLTYKF